MALPKVLTHQLKGGRLVDPRNNRDGSMSFSRPGGGKKVTYTAFELGRTPQGGKPQQGYLPTRDTQYAGLGQALKQRVPGALQTVQGAIRGDYNQELADRGLQQVDARRFGGLQTSTPQEGIAAGIPGALGMGVPVGWKPAQNTAQILRQALSTMPGTDRSGYMPSQLGHATNPYMGHGNQLGFWDTLKGYQTTNVPSHIGPQGSGWNRALGFDVGSMLSQAGENLKHPIDNWDMGFLGDAWSGLKDRFFGRSEYESKYGSEPDDR